MLDIDSLDEICPECSGHGRIENPNWSRFWSKHEKLKEWFSRLGVEEQMEISQRMLPEQPAEPMFYTCKHCHGKGKILTEEGLKLIEFVRLWMNPNY